MHEITLELTNLCSNQCWHCSSNASPDGSLMLDRKKALSLLREAIDDFGVTKVNFSGGEPFSYPYLYALLGETSRNNVMTRIYTSGSVSWTIAGVVSSQPLPASQARDLLPYKPIISFNFLGAQSYTHNRLADVSHGYSRTKSYHNLLLSMITFLKEGHDVEATFVPCRDNKGELPALISMLANMGVYKLKILRLVEQGRAVHILNANPHLRLSKEEEMYLIDAAMNCANESGVKVLVGAPFNPCMFTKKPCALRQWSDENKVLSPQKIVVTPSGVIVPCEALKGQSRDYVGPETIREALESDPFRHILEESKDDELLTVCPVHHVGQEES